MKDQLVYELGQKGVTATFDPVTGLQGLISKIADIQGGEAILLTTNKNILSYADSDTATLTAVHSGGSGKSLSVYNAVSGSKIGDMTDNQDGTYSYTYSSTGTGDISMTCATLTGESNSTTIEDCVKYLSSTSYTSTGVAQYNFNEVYDCGSSINAEITGKIKCSMNAFGVNYSEATNNINGSINVMVAGNNKKMANVVFSNGTDSNTTTTDFSVNTDIPFKIEYDNGTAKIYIDDNLVQTTNSIGFNPRHICLWAYGHDRSITLTDLKVKPL